MVLNRVCFAAFGAMIFAWSGLSVAQQYRPGEYLNLDLSRARVYPANGEAPLMRRAPSPENRPLLHAASSPAC